jgi:hypothetical protein
MLLQGRDWFKAVGRKPKKCRSELNGSHVVEFFGDRPLDSITPDDVAEYRVQRVGYSRTTCGECGNALGKVACPVCGWKRTDSSFPVSMQTINHDARSSLFGRPKMEKRGWCP